MKKICIMATTFISLLFVLTGCSHTSTFKHVTAAGDRVSVELDTTDGYDFVTDKVFVISKDDKEVTTGTFITADDYSGRADELINEPDKIC